MATSDPLIDTPRERLRLESLAGLAIMDSPSEREFDAIVDLAHRLLDCPIALVSLLDGERQWFKARYGIDADERPRDRAFCGHAIRETDIMVVEDTTRDPRFVDNPFVIGPPYIRFYAGVPLRPVPPATAGEIDAIGTLCVLDTRPRVLSADDRVVLRTLADLTDSLIRARVAAAEARSHASIINRKNRQLRQAERMASIGSWRYDVATGTVEWSDEVFAIHGLPPGTPPPVATALGFYPDADRARIATMLRRAATHGEPYDFESDLTTATGAIKRVRSVAEIEMAEGRPTAVIGVFQDITERHAHEKVLRRTANTDSLTGLPNRRMFEERLGEVAQHSGRTGEPYAILIVDLDGFKPVNDTLGHEAGDEVLREMAGRLRGQNFAHAFVARLGGDEFVMLVTRPRDCADLPVFVQSLLRELRYMVERDGVRLAVTATVGAALWEGSDSAGLDILKEADLALYAAKRAQRGTGRIFGSSDMLQPWGVRKSTPLRSIG